MVQYYMLMVVGENMATEYEVSLDYKWRWFMYFLFTSAVNILALNLLISVIGAVFDDVVA